MINTILNVDDICQDCPYFSTETDHLTNYDNMHMIYISCEHRDLCNRIRKHIEKEMNKNDKIRSRSSGEARADGEIDIYNKAIDDFAILIKETLNHDWATTKISEQIIYNRLFDKCNEIAEQLKEGGKKE